MEENKIKISGIKIELLGDTEVGKTATMNSILGLEFKNEMIMTIGTDKSQTKFKLKNNEDIKLVIRDTSGDEFRRSIAIHCMKAVHGIMLIFDFTIKKSFENMIDRLTLIKENLDDPLIVLIRNKTDKENDRKITSEEASKFSKEKGFAYF